MRTESQHIGNLVLSVFSVLTAAFFYLLNLGFNFNMPKHFFNHFFFGGGQVLDNKITCEKSSENFKK